MYELVRGADPAERFLTRRLPEKTNVEVPRVGDAFEMRALGTVAEDDESALRARRAVIRTRRDVVDDLVDPLARHETTRADIKAPRADGAAFRLRILPHVGNRDRARH